MSMFNWFSDQANKNLGEIFEKKAEEVLFQSLCPPSFAHIMFSSHISTIFYLSFCFYSNLGLKPVFDHF